MQSTDQGQFLQVIGLLKEKRDLSVTLKYLVPRTAGNTTKSGLMKDHVTRAFESLKKCTGKSSRGVSKYTGPAKFSLALACWPWSFISPDNKYT